MRTNFHHLLSQAADSHPDRPAFTYRNRTVTYAEAWAQTQVFGGQLAEAGLAAGDRVVVYLEKRIETVVAAFAVSLAGGVLVPANPALKAMQVAHILADSGALFLVTSADRLTNLIPQLDSSEVAHVIVIGAPDPRWDLGPTLHQWREGDHGGDAVPEPARIDIDPAAILYTSGSTGKPKGVVLSHRNLIVGAESVSTYLENSSEDVILSLLPLSFDAGLSQVTTAVSVGAHCVLVNFLLPGDVPRICAAHGVTGLTAVPPLWIQLADTTWPEAATRSMRYWANTGGRMPRTTLDRLRAIFPAAKPYLMYGLTEAFRSTYLDPSEVDRRPDSIGKAIPNAEILVLRADGTPCAPGEQGELVHRGALVTLGYWNDPARTAEVFRPVVRPGQEWRAPELAVWSGDTVVADEDGFLYFVGRRDEMIKTSGYRVSPTEIEEAAFSTGLVREAVALGVPDDTLGQRIVLIATPRKEGVDQGAIVEALRRILPLYMVPGLVELWSDLPRSPNGKLDRTLIKQELGRVNR